MGVQFPHGEREGIKELEAEGTDAELSIQRETAHFWAAPWPWGHGGTEGCVVRGGSPGPSLGPAPHRSCLGQAGGSATIWPPVGSEPQHVKSSVNDRSQRQLQATEEMFPSQDTAEGQVSMTQATPGPPAHHPGPQPPAQSLLPLPVSQPAGPCSPLSAGLAAVSKCCVDTLVAVGEGLRTWASLPVSPVINHKHGKWSSSACGQSPRGRQCRLHVSTAATAGSTDLASEPVPTTPLPGRSRVGGGEADAVLSLSIH